VTKLSIYLLQIMRHARNSWSLGAYPRHAQASSGAYKYDADVVKHIAQQNEACFTLGKHVTDRGCDGVATKCRVIPMVISGLRACLFSIVQILRSRAQASRRDRVERGGVNLAACLSSSLTTFDAAAR
jgi:hypothetical protein